MKKLIAFLLCLLLSTPCFAVGVYKDGVEVASSFTDRGDPSSADFTQATLTTDGTYRDLDLSGVDGWDSTVKAAVIDLRIRDGAAGNYVALRANGNSNTIALQGQYTQAANVYAWGNLIVPLDENGVCEYAGTNTTFTNVLITVVGWIK